MILLENRRLRRLPTMPDACWEWTGPVSTRGYGKVHHLYVHRIVADLAGIPGHGPNVLHHCDNTICFNPSHLFRGTQADNLQDANNKGRLNKKSLENLIPGARWYA